MREAYRDVVLELGLNWTAKYCGIYPMRLIAYLYLNHTLSEDAKRRLDFLTEVINRLYNRYKQHSGEVFKWFMRKRKRLGNFSPHELLINHADYLFASHAEKILDLAKGIDIDAT